MVPQALTESMIAVIWQRGIPNLAQGINCRCLGQALALTMDDESNIANNAMHSSLHVAK